MKKAFTLAEVLITITIVGIIAAIVIPSVIENGQQSEFRTGLKKAVSVLNSAITLSIALDNDDPYNNVDTWNFLIKHMSVVKTTDRLPWTAKYVGWGQEFKGQVNAGFYTNDGMRFEMDDSRGTHQASTGLKLHESDMHACLAIQDISLAGQTGWAWDHEITNPDHKGNNFQYVSCGGCGSLGLGENPNGTTKVPCAILVDVNGDRKPTPKRVYNNNDESTQAFKEGKEEEYWVPDLSSRRLSDIFVILITEDRAIPYGVVAQRAMYSGSRDRNLWGKQQ